MEQMNEAWIGYMDTAPGWQHARWEPWFVRFGAFHFKYQICLPEDKIEPC